MKNQLEVERLKTNSDFRALQEEWKYLLVQSTNNSIFLTWEWLFAWWQAYGDNFELWLLTVRENGVLIGIAPFMLATYKKLFFKLRVLLSIGTPQCDISGFVKSKDNLVLESIFDYLKAHKNEWDILEMKALPKSEREADTLPWLFQKNGGYRTIKKVDEHFYLPLNLNWEEYFHSLSKNLIHNLNRRIRRAEELGSISYKLYSGKELKWDHFLTIFEINRKGNFPNLYKHEKHKEFQSNIYESMNMQNWLQIEILFINNEPVAYQYGFIYNNKYYDWRGGFDIKNETLGVGKILMMFSIQNHFNRQIQEIDFLRGTHSYKADWKPLAREFVDLRIFRIQKIESLVAYFWLSKLKPIIKRTKTVKKLISL